jgi:hypothetical protein
MTMIRTDSIRFDFSSARVDESTGWWRIDGTAALEGVLRYPEGNEYVPASTLAASAPSIVGMPVIVRHPSNGKLLDVKTTRDYQGGSVTAARMDGGKLRVELLLTDERAISAVQAGVDELSPGYDVAVEKTSGEFNGERYDAVQVSRKYNHLALVDRARGGREARLDEDEKKMAKVKIGEIDYEVPQEVADYIAGMQKTDELPPKDAESVKMDSAEIVEKVTKSVIEGLNKERIRLDAEARSLGDTVAKCRPHLPQSYRTDGKDRGQILADAIVAIKPDLAAVVKQNSTSVERLDGMFDGLVSGVVPVKLDNSRKDAQDEDPVSAARARQAEKLRAVDGGKK